MFLILNSLANFSIKVVFLFLFVFTSFCYAEGIECSFENITSSGVRVSKGIRLEKTNDDSFRLIDFVRTSKDGVKKYISIKVKIDTLECVFDKSPGLVTTCISNSTGTTVQFRELLVKYVSVDVVPQTGELFSKGIETKEKVSLDVRPSFGSSSSEKLEHSEFDLDFCSEI